MDVHLTPVGADLIGLGFAHDAAPVAAAGHGSRVGGPGRLSARKLPLGHPPHGPGPPWVSRATPRGPRRCARRAAARGSGRRRGYG
ncbi:hypothetical protein BU197_04635 [Streptomyces sp. CBMA291]|nr:hypothetical protein [Streptomyces sp. CBMA291]MBD0714943.1 hypothetical protein [Streptomyces sp. CBMA370]